jgi:ribosomal protein L7/L12
MITPDRRSTDKPSNPKEAFGDSRVPMDLAPDTAIAWMNMAFLEGALKYGKYNWRVCGVKVSTYIRAMRRHISKYSNGQNRDKKTNIHELASVMACCAILLDSEIKGNLVDDRQPKLDMAGLFDELEKVVAHLKEEFKDYSPTQYTELEHGQPTLIEVVRDTIKPARVKVLTYHDDRKISIIKAIRTISGYSLKEAKDLSELNNGTHFEVPINGVLTVEEASKILRLAGAIL